MITIDLKLLRSRLIRFCKTHRTDALTVRTGVSKGNLSQQLDGRRNIPFNLVIRYTWAINEPLVGFIHGHTEQIRKDAEEEVLGYLTKVRPSSREATERYATYILHEHHRIAEQQGVIHGHGDRWKQKHQADGTSEQP